MRLLFLFILSVSLFAQNANANTFQNNNNNNNNKIIQEIRKEFSEELRPLENKNQVYEFSYFDLEKALITIGKDDSHLNSLMRLFEGEYQGEKRLFIVGGQPSTKDYENSFVAFLLYRNLSGENVLIKLRRGDKEWEIVDKIERK